MVRSPTGSHSVHILITEDEPLLARFIARGLEAAGYDTAIAGDGREALERIAAHEWDLVVLDLLLPDLDGFDVLAALAKRQRPPRILVLSARQEVETRIAVLNGGASDFLAKPFSFDELLARVRAQTRTGPARPRPTMVFATLRLDDASREVDLDDGRRVELSAREYEVLTYLLRTPGSVVSRERLLNSIWKYQFDPRSNVVDVCVGRLRRKLAGMLEIDAIRGGGYRVRLNSDEGRDDEGDDGTYARSAANRDAPSMGASDGIDDRESEASASLAAVTRPIDAVETFEDAR
jgi:two-component system, OmpR family, copper resistance phosphate regulon response regulator CusR